MKILAIDPSSNKIETSTTGVVLLDNARLVDSWVVSYGMRGFADWFHEIGTNLEFDVVIVEEFKARDNDKSKDNSVAETIAYIQLCYPGAILQFNAGYKSDIPNDLLKILDLWKFEKGQNFYPLEKTVFGWATPNNKFDWQKTHGKMVYDPFSYSKEKWEDFQNYESYISSLPNFFRWEEIEGIENAVENNGFEIKFYQKRVASGNPEKLAEFRKLNLVTVDGKTAMAKQSFGRKTFERYLNQTGVAVDFPKLKPVNADTPLMLQLDGLIERAPHDMLIVSKSKQIVNVISERHPEIGIWTGDIQEGLYKKFVVATSQVLGVGVDGLQHKYQTIVVLDPVEEGSGEYDDYRQLLWRITGSRQQHDVNVIEFYYKES